MTCLDDRAIHAWIGGALPEPQRDVVRTHLDSCDSCRDLVVSALEGQWIGQTAGRYRLLELIGAGAMGEVYRAEDPELGRNVAIKIVHPGGSQERLLREARVMAKLAHVNAMRIYDVGMLGDRVFLAMELVQGGNLRVWFEKQPEPRDVIGTLRQAGAGLAAAHAAGLVHGDFKPDNVLVADDGRVLVTDFGLARLLTDDDAVPTDVRRSAETDKHPVAAPTVSRERVTSSFVGKTRGLAGTPAYMAPEQLAGHAATPASDQFSFCVTLFEGLYGERPFKGADVETLRAVQKTLVLPARPGVPRAVTRLLRRGLAIDPDARFSSMTELLDELEQPRRTMLLVGGGVFAAGVAAAVLVARGSSPVCADGTDQLAGVWDAAARAKVEQAFTAANQTFAKTSGATVQRELDAYANAWTTAYTETCQATHVRGEQSEALLDLRMHCLQRRKSALRATVDTLAAGDKTVLRDAVGAVASLPPIADCADVASLRELKELPADRELRAKIEGLDAEIARCRALAIAGNYKEATPCASAAAKRGAELKHDPAIAEAELTVGQIQLRLRDWTTAEAAYTRALLAAEAGRDTRTRARVLTGLMSIAGERALFGPGHERLDLATAVVKGLDDKELAADLAMAAGVFALREGKFEAAIETLQKCVAIREEIYGKDDGRIAEALVPMAVSYVSRGKADEAAKLLDRAVKLESAYRGDTHPAVGKTLHALAQIQVRMGKTDEALASHARSLAILRATYGDEHADVAQSIGAQAQIYLIAGRYAEAIPAAKKSAELMEKVAGPEHPDTAIAMSTLGATLSRAEDFEGALAAHQRALAIRMKALGPEHLMTTQSQVNLAMALRVLKRCPESLVLLEAARTARLKQLAPEHPDVLRVETTMADCHVDLGHADKAVPLLERMVASAEKAPRRSADDKVAYAMSSYGLARALWDAKPETAANRERAKQLAKRAFADLTALKDKRADSVALWAKKRKVALY